jgi:molybdate transport system substrate-binding protein
MNIISKIVSILILVALAGPVFSEQITVFAAASLTDSLKQIAADFEKSSGDKIVFNFGASGTLARQIEAGAPADIFISADEGRTDALAAKGLLVSGSRKNLLGNSLVIVTAPGSPLVSAPADLTNAAVKRIALGDAKIVPAGTYAKIYLEKLCLWPAVEPKVVPCENVRAVLAAVESGNVDAGIVYKTDADISKNMRVAFAVPMADGPKIVYPLALVKAAPQPEAAKKFMAYLNSEAAMKIFRGLEFLMPDAVSGK